MRLRSHIRIIFWSAFLLFIFNKLLVRPWIIETNVQGLIPIISFSIPIFIEAVMGVLILTEFLTYYGSHLFRNSTVLQITSVSLAGVYVINQEFKIHNLGHI